jgi:hypothetical protein
MTADKFVSTIEAIYSPYPQLLRGSIVIYMSRKPDWYRDLMIDIIQTKISTRFKTPPGIADFSEAEKDCCEAYQAIEMRRPLQIEAPAEDCCEGLEFLALLTAKMARGINPGKDPEVQAVLRKIESTYK